MAGRRPSSTSTPFDALAEGYDRDFSDTPLGAVLRAAVWRRTESRLRPGGSVLELGCGTGIDALRLAEAGMRVTAVDASQTMVDVARRRCRDASGSIRLEQGDLRRLDAVPGCGGPFDLVFSNFGPLNCVGDLGAAMASIAARLTDDGAVVAVIMGRVVPWEWAWMVFSGRPRSALRRLRPGGVEWRGLRVRYHTPGSVRRAARSAGLRVERTAGLGALLPVTEAGPWLSGHRGLMTVLNGLERRFEAAPPLPWLADHLLVEMEAGSAPRNS